MFYLVLTVQRYTNMKPDIVRHGKATNAYRASLRKPSIKDYEKLVEVCITAIIDEEVDIAVSFSYLLKFPKDFPRGILESREIDGSNVHRIKAKRLLMWLHDNGHTAATVEMLGAQKRNVTKMLMAFD